MRIGSLKWRDFEDTRAHYNNSLLRGWQATAVGVRFQEFSKHTSQTYVVSGE